LNAGAVRFELYVIKNQEPIKIGSCKQNMLDLVKKNTSKDISAVMSGNAAIRN
jgi:hypothetical protein